MRRMAVAEAASKLRRSRSTLMADPAVLPNIVRTASWTTLLNSLSSKFDILTSKTLTIVGCKRCRNATDIVLTEKLADKNTVVLWSASVFLRTGARPLLFLPPSFWFPGSEHRRGSRCQLQKRQSEEEFESTEEPQMHCGSRFCFITSW